MNFAYYIALGRGCQKLPIAEIDGVKVVVWVEPNCRTGWKNSVKVEVIVKNSPCMDSKLCDNETEFAEAIDRMKNLKFNKADNCFVDGRKHTTIPDENFYKCLESPNIKFSYDECCVCLEKTTGKAKCGHHICGVCASSLKKCSCPLCRKYLRYKEDYPDEDEDDGRDDDEDD